MAADANLSDVLPNPSDKGSERERVYKDFLKMHLPDSCNTILGGYLFDLDGTESKQLDLIVTNSTSIRFGEMSKEFACVEGSLAVVEVKSNLDTEKLFQALEGIASVPPTVPLERRRSPIITIPNYNDWPYKIIYAHKGNKLETIYQSLNEFYLQYPTIPFTRRPNLIHVNGKGHIVRVGPEGRFLRNGEKVPANTFWQMLDSTNVYAFMEVIKEIQSRSQASLHILYDYSSMIDRISF